MAPIDSLRRCMAPLHLQEIKAHSAGFRALSPNAMSHGFFGILRHETFELSLGFFMVEERLACPAKHPGELGPGVRGSHVDDPHGLNTGPRRLDVEQPWRLAALD